MNDKVMPKVMRAVLDSYNGEEMPVGDEVVVVLKDSTVLVKMELNGAGEKTLSINVCADKPIMLTHYNLFDKES